MSTGPDHGDAPSAADRRTGILAGVGAYTLWGVFPLVFHQIQEVLPAEVLMHRVTWSFVVVAGLLGIRRDTAWWGLLRTPSVTRTRLAASAALITVNWLVYVWAVSEGRLHRLRAGRWGVSMTQLGSPVPGPQAPPQRK